MKYIIGLILSFIPAFCFAAPYHSGYYPNSSYNVLEKVVEFDADYYLGTYGYYKVLDNIKAEKLSAEDAEKAYLRGKIDALNEIIKNMGGKPPVQGETPANPPMQPEPELPSLDKKVYDIFKAKCGNCHGSDKQDGELQLVKEGNVLVNQPVEMRALIHHRTNGVNLDGDAKMPKGGSSLTDEEVEVLRAWLVKGAKDKLGK